MSFMNFIIAMVCLAILGAVSHVVRAVINLYPDRLSDRPLMDIVVSDGYSVEDHILQVEYDDYGFYRLDSRRNVIITMVLTMLGGFFVTALDAAASNQISGMITTGLGLLWEHALKRGAELGLL
jgi:hypothetical protein